jgi:hypothetical protein
MDQVPIFQFQLTPFKRNKNYLKLHDFLAFQNRKILAVVNLFFFQKKPLMIRGVLWR